MNYLLSNTNLSLSFPFKLKFCWLQKQDLFCFHAEIDTPGFSILVDMCKDLPARMGNNGSAERCRSLPSFQEDPRHQASLLSYWM